MNYIYRAIMLFGLFVNSLTAMEVAQELQEKQSSFMKSFLNGACAGSIEVMVSNPLIVLKNELILKTKGGTSNPTVAHTPYAALKAMMHKYYKGCGTGILFMAPITAVQNSTALVLAELFKGQNESTLTQKAVAAFCGGTCSALIESPADLLVLQRQNPAYKHEEVKETWQRIYAVRGLPTFYRGAMATCTRDGTITLAYKTGGDIIQKWFPFTMENSTAQKVACDAVAAIVAATVSQPADVISARMKSDLAKNVYKSSVQTALDIVRKEGYTALFKGLIPRGSRILLAVPLLSALTQREVGTNAIEYLEKICKS